MKKYIKYLSFSILAAIGLSSCEADDDGYKPDPIKLGGYTYLADRSITSFDQDAEVEISLFSNDNVSFETIEIFQGETSVGTATIKNDSTAAFSASALGDLETGDAFPLTIVATLSNGKTAESSGTVSVDPAIELDENPGSVIFMDTTSVALSYVTYTHSAVIDDVDLFTKINSGGTYTENDVELDIDGDAINLGDIDYNAWNVMVGDTIFYKFVAESGELSEEVIAPIVVQPQPEEEPAEE